MLNTSKHTYTQPKKKKKTNRFFTQEPQKCTIFQKQKHIDMHKYMST